MRIRYERRHQIKSKEEAQLSQTGRADVSIVETLKSSSSSS